MQKAPHTYTIFSKTDEIPRRLWNNFKNESITTDNYPNRIIHWGCYNAFYRSFDSNYNYYFGFPGVPDWYEGLVDEFNSTFNNIKIEVLECKDLYTENSRSNYLYFDSSEYRKEKLSFPLFKLLLHPDYDKRSAKWVSLLIHHFMRLISAGEKRILKIDYKTVDSNFLNTVIELNNLTNKKNSTGPSGYRALSEYNLTLEEFLLLDDIELVNEASKCYTMSMPRQTGLLLTLINLKTFKFKFKIGDTVFYNNKYDRPKPNCKVLYQHNENTYCIFIPGRGLATAYDDNLIKSVPNGDTVNRDGKFKIKDLVATKKTARRYYDPDPFINKATVIRMLEYPFIEIDKDGTNYILDERKLKKYYPPKIKPEVETFSKMKSEFEWRF